jgi:sarcosine oxidase subunit alpha
MFYLSISTSSAASVYREMQRWLQIWKLNVALINVTGAYSLINVAGPKSRDLINKLLSLDLSNLEFPLGSGRELDMFGFPIRIIRVSFVSKIAYEIHCPAAYGLVVWEALMDAGASYNIQPFGTDAQRLLRLELGHCMPGVDTDGLTNPFEIGEETRLHMEKPFFIGKRSIEIIAKKSPNKKLVSFVLNENFVGEMPLDCNLVIESGAIKGRVTSIAYSPAAKRIVGLAYVHPSQAVLGNDFEIRTDNGSLVKATVCSTPFFNAE